MAVVSLNTNLSSLLTQRRLAQATSSLAQSYERLSSGLRVSRASDDAAGLAVASGLNVDSRVFSQGLRNLADGVSVTNIAEGALNELTNIVLRLEELAEQASNGTLGLNQRSAIDAEAQALSKEYLRIAQATAFNGRKLLDGSVQGLNLQAGYGAEGGLQSSLGGTMGTGSFNGVQKYGSGQGAKSLALGDLNGDGVIDIVNADDTKLSVLLGNGDGSFKSKTDLLLLSAYTVKLGDFDGDSVLDIAASAGARVSVFRGNGDGTFAARSDLPTASMLFAANPGDVNGDGKTDIVAFGESNGWLFLGNGDGTFAPSRDILTGGSLYASAFGDLNNDRMLDLVVLDANATVLLGNGDGTFKTKETFATGLGPAELMLGDVNGDDILDVVTANYVSGTASVLLGNGDGSFKAKADYVTGATEGITLGDLNGDGALDIVSATTIAGNVAVLLGNSDGSFASRSNFSAGAWTDTVAVGDLNRDGVLDLVAGIGTVGTPNVAVFLARTREGVSPLLPFSLKTKADAKWALELTKQKLTQLSQQRGIIGANQSRLSTAVANLRVERENYDAARSRITDVDVAAESAALVRTQILQQAASAVLSQANAAPALALRLLQG